MIQWGPKIETGNAPAPQLYDMTRDVGEERDCAREHPDIVTRFDRLLEQLRTTPDARMP